MARTNTTIIGGTNGFDSGGWYDRRKAHTLSGSVVITHGTAFATLPVTIPPRARVIWARLSNQTTVPVTGGIGTAAGSTIADGYGIIGWPTTGTAQLTSPPSTASVTFANATGTNGGIILVQTASASAATARGVPLSEKVAGSYGTNAGIFQNTNTTPAYLALVPVLVSSTNSYAYNAIGTNSARTATNTSSGGVFGTATVSGVTTNTSSVYFEIYCEEFAEVSGT